MIFFHLVSNKGKLFFYQAQINIRKNQGRKMTIQNFFTLPLVVLFYVPLLAEKKPTSTTLSFQRYNLDRTNGKFKVYLMLFCSTSLSILIRLFLKCKLIIFICKQFHAFSRDQTICFSNLSLGRPRIFTAIAEVKEK